VLSGIESFGEVRQKGAGLPLITSISLAKKRVLDIGKPYGVFYVEHVETLEFSAREDEWRFKFRVISEKPLV
jgi:hypothetical protein